MNDGGVQWILQRWRHGYDWAILKTSAWRSHDYEVEMTVTGIKISQPPLSFSVAAGSIMPAAQILALLFLQGVGQPDSIML